MTHYRPIVRSFSMRRRASWYTAVLALSVLLAGCGSTNAGLTPRETAAAILYITPAATLDINATVTAYALGMVPSPTPSGMYIVKSGDTLLSLIHI